MKIVKANVKIWGQTPLSTSSDNLTPVKKWIERVGRVAYRSEDKITEASYETFVGKMLKLKHMSVLEGSNLVTVDTNFESAKYLTDINGCTGGNLRAWMEELGCETIEGLYEMLHYMGSKVISEDVPNELKRVTVEFICNRAVSHQLVRSRGLSFIQESQRYVGYLEELEFIEPQWYSDPTVDEGCKIDFRSHCEATEQVYHRDLKRGLRREQARANLTNAVKTRIVVTGSLLDWSHFFFLRCASGADPETRSLSKYTRDCFESNGWLLN